MTTNLRRERTLTTTIFIISSILLITPIVMLVLSATDNFSTTATVTNQPPLIQIDASQTVSGQTAGVGTVYLLFNATHQNGWSSLNDSTARLFINKTGEATRSSSSCAAQSHPSALSTIYNCTLSIWYFDAPGAWSLNATINDTSGNTVTNVTNTGTVGNIFAVAATSASIAFSGAPGSVNNAASPAQQLNNTGNQNFGGINVTGYNLFSGSNFISVGNVSANSSNSGGLGQTLINGTKVQLQNSALTRGNNSRTNIFFWLNVPAGVPAGSYTSQSNWILEAN